jgi:mannose-6-phosphate isomerase-like protein (cupin superfamily)
MDAYRCPQNVFGDGEEKIVYDSPSFPLYFREGKISSFYERKALPHYHADFEYIKINSGELGYEVNGKRYLLKKGEGLFVNAMALHYGYGIGEEECDFLCLIFPSYLLANCPEIEERLLAPYLEKESALFLPKDSKALALLDRYGRRKKVRGTRSALTHFFMSFGERRFRSLVPKSPAFLLPQSASLRLPWPISKAIIRNGSRSLLSPRLFRSRPPFSRNSSGITFMIRRWIISRLTGSISPV